MFHLAYQVVIAFYIYVMYVWNSPTWKYHSLTTMMLGIVYPLLYDTYQLYKYGWKNYFTSFWNYIDFSFIWLGMLNLLMQVFSDPFSFSNKLCQTAVILLAIFKTFYFVRIFKNFSGIVIMLVEVIYELRIFLFFYAILVLFFGLIFMVIGAGNINVPG